jgi:hypothetical protein
VPYLANAYRLADGDEDRAVTLFSSGYYYTAHQKKMLATLRTASSPPVASESLPPPEPALIFMISILRQPRGKRGRIEGRSPDYCL